MTEDEFNKALADAWWEGYCTRYDWNQYPDPDEADNPYDVTAEAATPERTTPVADNLLIRTAYVKRPGSNVGGYRATLLGRQRTIVDQSLTDPHRVAAETLAAVMADVGMVVTLTGEERVLSEDGQRRAFPATSVSA